MSLVKAVQVAEGHRFRLADVDPAARLGLPLDKAAGRERLAVVVRQLADLQVRLHADARWALLVIVQSMDAGGKDGAIRHVMAGVDPNGFDVTAFKPPSAREARHDFLWRTTAALPERGRIAIHNRSHYEEVLVPRVHPERLGRHRDLAGTPDDRFWEERFESIRDAERHLWRNGTAILKVFLHMSRHEQRRRLLARIDRPDKQWKVDPDDLAERERWDDYMQAYEAAIRATATNEAPWHVVPADRKWFARLVLAEVMVDRLRRLDPRLPVVDDAKREQLQQARAKLGGE